MAGVPFWLEALEPDYIPLEKTDNSSNLVQGIYFNEWRRPVKYLVCQSWPGAGAAAVAVKEVTAENMLHLRFTRRLNQARGASLLAPVIIRLMDLKEYEDSERIAARIAASLGMFIKKQDVGTDGYVAPEKRKETQIQPGMLFDGLNPGEDIGMIKSDRPNAGLESFRMGQLRAVAAGLRGSFSSIARNYDGTYSAQRQELVEAQEGYSILQDSFIAAFTRPLYRRWLAAAVASGAIEVPAGTDMSSLFNAVYSGPVMPWIDPLKEANAWRVLIRGGAATEGDWVRARGGAPADVKRRRKAETDENRSWGWCLTPIRRMKPESNPMLKRKKRTLKSPPRAMAAARGKNESGAESWYTIARWLITRPISVFTMKLVAGEFRRTGLPKSWWPWGVSRRSTCIFIPRVAVFSTGWPFTIC